MTELHIGDIGTIVRVTFKEAGEPLDISTATVKRILFQRKDRTGFFRNGTLSTDGTDGKLYYLTVAGDLDLKGQWKVQGYVEMPGGKWHTEISDAFEVEENIEVTDV